MRNKETGEFELVVGDKQLLSGFFIGVLLLAVVFAMGYVLGRGTPRTAAAPQEAVATPPAEHPASPASPQPSHIPIDSSPPVMNPDVGHPDDATAADQPPQPTTVPARDTSAPAQAAPPAAAPPPAPADESAPGTYWQVLAGSQTSAEAMSQTLKGRGFPVVTRPGRDNLTLVWVGPYSDKESLSKAKKRLEDAGMTNLFKKP